MVGGVVWGSLMTDKLALLFVVGLDVHSGAGTTQSQLPFPPGGAFHPCCIAGVASSVSVSRAQVRFSLAAGLPRAIAHRSHQERPH